MNLSALPHAHFLRFAVVGGLGFGVDVGVLYLLARHWGMDLYSGRVVSFLVAASFTWVGNRAFTFAGGERARRLHDEWVRYVGAMAVGGAINYGLYALFLNLHPLFPRHPWLAVAAATACSMCFNFWAARRLLQPR